MSFEDEKVLANDLEKSDAKMNQKFITEKLDGSNFHDKPDGQMQRRLKPRHMSMIAIGGTIGTGLFVGSGQALNEGGPLAILLGYSIMGVVVYSVMVSLGEMVTMFPVTGAFIHYTTRFVDPALGFALGWNYWYSYAITLPTEITAAGIVIQYWTKSVNVAVWITLFLVASSGINFFGVKWYGEAEFFCSAIKVIAIVGLMILGIIIDLGGGPNHDRIGFRYWNSPGPFNQFNGIAGGTGRFLAFWSVFVQAAFSYQGTEIVALAAGEAHNPRKTVPKAINRVFYRILLFYVGGVSVIGLLVPYNSPDLLGGTGDAASSPFVIAIKSAGISILPDIVNAVILTAVFSAANSDLYAGSRILFGLATDGMAPANFSRCTRNGLPIAGLTLTTAFGMLAYMNVNTSGGTVFQWFANLSSVTGLLTWWSISFTYIRFYHGLQHNQIDRNTFAYKAPCQPWLSYFSITMITLITFFNGFQVFLSGNWSTSKFISAYISVPVFIIFFLAWKLYHKTALIRVDQMDFVTGKREFDLMDKMEEEKAVEPVGKLAKFLEWLM